MPPTKKEYEKANNSTLKDDESLRKQIENRFKIRELKKDTKIGSKLRYSDHIKYTDHIKD